VVVHVTGNANSIVESGKPSPPVLATANFSGLEIWWADSTGFDQQNVGTELTNPDTFPTTNVLHQFSTSAFIWTVDAVPGGGVSLTIGQWAYMPLTTVRVDVFIAEIGDLVIPPMDKEELRKKELVRKFFPSLPPRVTNRMVYSSPVSSSTNTTQQGIDTSSQCHNEEEHSHFDKDDKALVFKTPDSMKSQFTTAHKAAFEKLSNGETMTQADNLLVQEWFEKVVNETAEPEQYSSCLYCAGWVAGDRCRRKLHHLWTKVEKWLDKNPFEPLSEQVFKEHAEQVRFLFTDHPGLTDLIFRAVFDSDQEAETFRQQHCSGDSLASLTRRGMKLLGSGCVVVVTDDPDQYHAVCVLAYKSGFLPVKFPTPLLAR